MVRSVHITISKERTIVVDVLDVGYIYMEVVRLNPHGRTSRPWVLATHAHGLDVLSGDGGRDGGSCTSAHQGHATAPAATTAATTTSACATTTAAAASSTASRHVSDM